MSQEELMELQKKNCIFCRIIAGEQDAKKIYEDDRAIAILDIFPSNPGHVLVVPKEHYSIMPQIPDDMIGHMFWLAQKVSHSMLGALKVQGTNIFVANGGAAGQKAPHFMIHVVPRYSNDGLQSFSFTRKALDEATFDETYNQLGGKMKELLGVSPPSAEGQKQPVSQPNKQQENSESSKEVQQKSGEQKQGQTNNADRETEKQNGKNAQENSQTTPKDNSGNQQIDTPPKSGQKEKVTGSNDSDKKGADLDKISKLFG